MVLNQLEAFLLTLAIELPVAFLFARFAGVPWWRALIAGLVSSTLTHPFVWWLNGEEAQLALPLPMPPLFAPLGPWIRLGLLELGAVLVEAMVYQSVWRIGVGRALVVSFVANALSFGIGLALFALLDPTR